MRTRVVAWIALFFGILLPLVSLISFIRPDLTGFRSYSGFFVSFIFLGYARSVLWPAKPTPPSAPR